MLGRIIVELIVQGYLSQFLKGTTVIPYHNEYKGNKQAIVSRFLFRSTVRDPGTALPVLCELQY